MIYSDFLYYLNSLIIRDKDRKFSGLAGLKRVGEILKELGDPQDSYPVIHIAGTSGKGSTAFILSSLLKSVGLKTGLLLSPHIKDIRERISIDGELISEKDFLDTFMLIKPGIDKIGDISYFELLTIIAFKYFANKGVTYAVIETGLGGLLDATNSINRTDKISVITKIGLDHTHILGERTEEIAFQKAGIIVPNSRVFVIDQAPEVIKMISKVAQEKKAQLEIVANPIILDSYNNIAQYPNWGEIKLGLYGQHQLENAALCLKVFDTICNEMDLNINKDMIKRQLNELAFAGRFEIIKTKGHEIIIDGAHNPQKIAALVKAVNTKYQGLKKRYIISYKANKDVMSCLKYISASADKIYLTSFEDNAQLTKPPAYSPSEMAKHLEEIGFHNYEILKDVNLALNKALQDVEAEVIIITGSMYLISNVKI
jgi:dihydrofolate synthase/folylpolyglutamate synthase